MRSLWVTLLPATPPGGKVNDKALVFEVPHPKGAVPEPTVKFSDTEERVLVLV